MPKLHIETINDLEETVRVLSEALQQKQSYAMEQYYRAFYAERGIERIKALTDSVPVLSNKHVDWLSDIIELVNEVAS